jgi:cell division protein FtsI/penicillin-binding protein 2
VDRSNKPIASTIGQPGSFQRQYDYPPLSNTVGYNSPLYGQAGLEAGLDGYLRGLQGNPNSLILLDELLYSQPPPGLDIRLTIDLTLQKQADALLQNHKGALVLLNARTGEILSISSHPNFDPNKLEPNWASLIQDSNAPLLNRATQGQYSPGSTLGPFLLAYANAHSSLTVLPNTLTYSTPAGILNCAVEPVQPYTSAKLIADGCPGPLATLGQSLGAKALEDLFDGLGFYTRPNLPLVIPAPSPRGVTQAELAAVGQENLLITPLQMALAAAALTNNGQRPAPELSGGILVPGQGWQTLPPKPGQETPIIGGTTPTLTSLAVPNSAYWQTVALAHSNQEDLTWYIAGTLPQWQGSPLAVALILEEGSPDLAQKIGQTLLNSALK